jgi:hypothetical protein
MSPENLIEAACTTKQRDAHVKPEDWGKYEGDTEAQIEEGRTYLLNEGPEAIEGDGGREVTKRIIHELGDIGLTADRALELLLEDDGWNWTKPSWGHRRPCAADPRPALRHRKSPLGLRAWRAAGWTSRPARRRFRGCVSR